MGMSEWKHYLGEGLNKKELEKLFYELDFSNGENIESVIFKIAELIPWQSSVYDVIDELQNTTLRISTRKYSRLIQKEIANIYMASITKKGFTNNYDDLEGGVFLLSSMGDPSASYKNFKLKLDTLALRVGELFELNREILTDSVRIQLLSRVLHEEEGFSGNQSNYHNPDNSFVTRVVKSRKGIPISLSTIYILIGKRLHMPIYGINLPMHFMVSYETETFQSYIDPFNGGVQITKETCTRFLEANGYKDTSDHFRKTSTLTILKRMYNNLILIYRKSGELEKEENFSEQLKILERKKNNIV
jgi:regulator of sirC expression with transglutaminase-like and TPR domain